MPRLNLLHTAHKKQVISILQNILGAYLHPSLSLFSVVFSCTCLFSFPEGKSKKKHHELQKPEGFVGFWFGGGGGRGVLYNPPTLQIHQLLRATAQSALWCFTL